MLDLVYFNEIGWNLVFNSVWTNSDKYLIVMAMELHYILTLSGSGFRKYCDLSHNAVNGDRAK